MKLKRMLFGMGLGLVLAGLPLHAQPSEADRQALAQLRAKAGKGDAQAQCELGQVFAFGKLGVATNDVEAVKWFQQAAEQNDARAQHCLGVCYDQGLGVAKDYVAAMNWLRKAADQNYPVAQFNLGVYCRDGQGVAKNEVKAVEWFRKAAEQNDARAQHNLGFCYANGQGVSTNCVEAVKWFRQAAEQGFAEAQIALGNCYREGQGVAMNYVEAVKWFRKAAELNNAVAQNNLGGCYQEGKGVPKDPVEAAKWYRKAAEQNYTVAQYNLGFCYANGRGVTKDDAEAVRWFRKAADQGYAKAQYNLGVMYAEARGMVKDEAEAVRWYRKAAEQGHADAQSNLGVCYYKGEGVVKDEAEAVRWFRKAVDQGDAKAQNNLGVCYYKGEGVVKDEAEGYKWILLAGANGNEDARTNIPLLEAEMTREQIAEGQKRAGDYKPPEISPSGAPPDAADSKPLAGLRAKAETGDAKAQNELGEALCAVKLGVARDSVAAVKWFRQAAEQNFAPAQSNLGVCYERGDGVAKNEVEAYKWDLLAAAQGDKKAKRNASLLELMLSPEEIAEGKRRAQTWLEQRKATSATHAAGSVAPTNRLTVAMLAFADKTGDPESAHWRYSLPRMVASPLGEVKAIRIYPAEASEYGLRQLKLKAGELIDAAQARRIGELIEARRVVWGGYRHAGKAWTATAQVLNVASGKQSAELSATAADWFEVCDQLAGKILQELALQPTEAERARMQIHFTASPAALEFFSQGYALQAEGRPFAESERCERRAVAADPRCAEARVALASCLASQGKLEEGSQEIQEALKLKPELAQAHKALGIVMMLFQDKPEAAAKEFREAIRLNPDEPDHFVRLAGYHASQGEWMEAAASLNEARRLNPVWVEVPALLGFVYAKQGERTKALLELKNAEFLGLDDSNAAQFTAQAYDTLHEVPLAVEHYETFLGLARGLGVNPKLVGGFAERLQQLKASLTPVFVNAAEPKAYSEQSLREALQVRLSEEELALISFPLASTPEMKRWAEELTQGATNNFQKAWMLYRALARHLDPGPGGSRTAQETYADWQKPQASFRCQEYARLFVALARDVGLKAFWVLVDRDYEDKTVIHACAGVLLDGKAILVDPSYQWFGVPHKQFAFQDDYQAVVSQLNQTRDLSRNRLAVKLQPDSALSQFNLAGQLMILNQWDEARLVLQTALKLDSESWFAHGSQGILARHEGQPELAMTHLRKAVELYAPDPTMHFALAVVLWEQDQFKEAREEFRACLQCQPESQQAVEARHAIAELNEMLGNE